jgi:hypothetical protein
MVASQLNNPLGFIHPGLTLRSTSHGSKRQQMMAESWAHGDDSRYKKNKIRRHDMGSQHDV